MFFAMVDGATPMRGSSSPWIRGPTLLSEENDLVIVDTPPVNILADASVIAAVADSTLFIVRWGRSTAESLHVALQQLRRAGAGLIGSVMTRVDLRRHCVYGY